MQGTRTIRDMTAPLTPEKTARMLTTELVQNTLNPCDNLGLANNRQLCYVKFLSLVTRCAANFDAPGRSVS